MLPNLAIILLIGTGLGQLSALKKMSEEIAQGGKMEDLLASLTEEELHEVDELLHDKLLSGKSNSFDKEAYKNLDILSHDNLFQAGVAPITKEDLEKLAKIGLSKSDIEEITELSKVMISKDSMDMSDIIDNMSDDELLKMTDMSDAALENYVESLKIKNNMKNIPKSEDEAKIYLKSKFSSNPKHFTRRDAEPEPEPEPSPMAPQHDYGAEGGFYQSYYGSGTQSRGKRSPPGGFRLRMRTRLGFGKSPNGRYSDHRHSQHGTGYDGQYHNSGPYDTQGYRHRSRGSYYGDGGGSYGSGHEHRGRYGGGNGGGGIRFGYSGSWHRHRRSLDELQAENVQMLEEGKVPYKNIYNKVAEMVKTTKQERSPSKQPTFSAPPSSISSSSRTRPKRHINMDTLMKLVGMNRKVEHPEVLYMSAVMDGQKHELSTSREISNIAGIFETKQKSSFMHQSKSEGNNHKTRTYEIEKKHELKEHNSDSSTISQDPEIQYPEHQEIINPPPAEYSPTDSYKLAMSRAKLVKIH